MCVSVCVRWSERESERVCAWHSKNTFANFTHIIATTHKHAHTLTHTRTNTQIDTETDTHEYALSLLLALLLDLSLTHIHTHTHTHTHTLTHIHTHTHIHIHTHTNAPRVACAFVCSRAFVRKDTLVCMRGARVCGCERVSTSAILALTTPTFFALLSFPFSQRNLGCCCFVCQRLCHDFG